MESTTGNFAGPGLQFVFWREHKGDRSSASIEDPHVQRTLNHPLVLAALGWYMWVSRSWAGRQRRHISGRPRCLPAGCQWFLALASVHVVPEWGDNSRSLPDSGPTPLNPNTGPCLAAGTHLCTNCVHLHCDGIPTQLDPWREITSCRASRFRVFERHSKTTLSRKYEVHQGLAEQHASLSLKIPHSLLHPGLATFQPAGSRPELPGLSPVRDVPPHSECRIPSPADHTHTRTRTPFGCPPAVSRNGPLVLAPRAPASGIAAPLASADSPPPTYHAGRRLPESNPPPRPPYSTNCFPRAPSPRGRPAPRRAMRTSWRLVMRSPRRTGVGRMRS